MPLRYLRPGLPTSSPLTVSQLPHVAKLDQNESPIDLPDALKRDLVAELASRAWNRYPQPSEYDEARRRFALTLGLDPDTVTLTAGCDQAIQGAHFLGGGPGRKALVFEPTYPMLAHAGLMAGTTVHRVDLGPGYEITAEHFGDEAHLILLASPNNPTGSCIPEPVIATALARPSLVFVDEAYYDLSRTTVAPLLEDHPNLMIGRSCSKSLLAGMRLGYTIARPEVTLRLDQLLTAPYHLGHAQLIIARRFDEIEPYVIKNAEAVIAERERLASRLRGLGLDPAPSEANFLLLPIEKAAKVYEELARHGIRVRYAPKLRGLEGHLRATIGTPGQNDLFFATLSSIIRRNGHQHDA